MTTQSVAQHPASVDAYLRHGWALVPIPPNSKGPKLAGWNQRGAALRSQADLILGFGIGLAHAYSGTMALDIDSWDRACNELALQGIDLQGLYNAPDAVIIDSGRQGHGKLLYAMPFGLALPSKKITRNGTTIYELRCATTNHLTVQDVLPPSIHPDTKQPYRWAGRGHWTRLPLIPEALLDLWQSLLSTTVLDAVAPTSASWDEIISALSSINPDCSREEWIMCGMAIHANAATIDELEAGFGVWNTWSAKGNKYPGEREILTQWSSFRQDKSTRVQIGSLFHLARQNGWVKPMPDAAALFSPTEVITPPAQVSADLTTPPPNLDISLVPEVLRVRATEISEQVGCDPLVPLFAGLAAVCGALDARTRLELLPGFKVPPILWLMSIGEPGDKKTPGSKPMFSVLQQIEHEDRPRFAKQALEFEVQEVRYNSAKKALFDQAASPEALLANTAMPTLPAEPTKPVPCRITVSDITSQKLVRHAADRPRGLLCALDEMASWAGKLVDPRSGEDKSSWTVAYEGHRYEMDRVGAGTILAENYAVAIFGNIQPRVLRESLPALSKDGLLQRFIPVPLRANQTRLGHPLPEYMTSAAAYDQMIRVCYGLPAMTYRLSEEARVLFREFQAWYQARMVDERLLRSSETFQTALGKIEGLCGRVALVWHAIESPYSIEVSGALMERVVRFIKGYVIPAQRYVFDGELADSQSLGQWMVDYVVQYADEQVITLSQIRRSARRPLEKVKLSPMMEIQAVLLAMQPLEDARWVARMDDGSSEFKGIAQWAVNPSLAKTFKDHRIQVLEAKQRMMDEMYKDNWKQTGAPRVAGIDGVQQLRKEA
jgi:hypothetical protein